LESGWRLKRVEFGRCRGVGLSYEWVQLIRLRGMRVLKMVVAAQL